MLTNKKIVLISVRFFGYEEDLKNAIIQLGGDLRFYDDRPSNSVLFKGILRKYPLILKAKISGYYQQILQEILIFSPDYFLLIKGEAIPAEFLVQIRKLVPKCRLLFYHWDSLEEAPKAKEFLKLFHHTFSFDPKDALQSGMTFRPNFVRNVEIFKPNISPTYDVGFLGSTHTDRLVFLQEFKKKQNKNLNFDWFLYAQNPMTLYLRTVFDSHFKYNASLKKSIHFYKLSPEESLTFYQKSKIQLDIQKAYQTGLSMRAGEVLALNRKLISTNPDIEKYPFYSPEIIQIMPRGRISQVSETFIKEPFRSELISDEIWNQMSVTAWITDIFSENKENFWVQNYG